MILRLLIAVQSRKSRQIEVPNHSAGMEFRTVEQYDNGHWRLRSRSLQPPWGIVAIALVTSGGARCRTALALAWCAVGRKLRRAARRVVPAGAAIAAFVGPGISATAQTTLADVKSIQCTFTRQATGRWTKDGATETAVLPSSLVLRFEAIDTETGTAQLRNGAMTTDVIVRLTEGYLHLMQAFRTGPLYTTTVFGAGATAGVFRAAHSRHELFATPLPGATSSPEQYYGTCEPRE